MPCAADSVTVPRLAVLLTAAVVALSLPACGNRQAGPESPGQAPAAPPAEPSRGAALLPRDAILPLSAVQKVLPEISQETATGKNETILGDPTGTRSVTYATADGKQRVVISVDQYPSADEASAEYEKAVQGSLEAPGGKGESVSGLGEKAFLGVSARGDETHVGGGALYGDRIVTATLQGYAGTNENKARVREIIRRQAAAGRAP